MQVGFHGMLNAGWWWRREARWSRRVRENRWLFGGSPEPQGLDVPGSRVFFHLPFTQNIRRAAPIHRAAGRRWWAGACTCRRSAARCGRGIWSCSGCRQGRTQRTEAGATRRIHTHTHTHTQSWWECDDLLVVPWFSFLCKEHSHLCCIVVQSCLFLTPGTAVLQASLSFITS